MGSCFKYLFCLLLIGLIAGCDKPKRELVIGVLYSAHSPRGQSLENSIRLVEKQLTGTQIGKSLLDKYTLKFVFEDTLGNQEGALIAVRKLLKYKKLIAIIGPNSSNEAIPVAEILEQARVPMISPASTHPKTTANKSYVFRIVFNDNTQAAALANFAKQKFNTPLVAILYDKANQYSQNLTQGFEQEFQRLFMTSPLKLSYLPGTTNFKPMLRQLQDANIDLLFLPNFDIDVNLQLIQINEMNFDIPLLGSDSWNPVNMIGLLDGRNVFYSHHWGGGLTRENENTRHFTASYQQVYDKNPTVISALSYDAVQLLLYHLARGATDAQSLRVALASTRDFEGVTGNISFSRSGDPDKKVGIYTIENNRIVFQGEVTR